MHISIIYELRRFVFITSHSSTSAYEEGEGTQKKIIIRVDVEIGESALNGKRSSEDQKSVFLGEIFAIIIRFSENWIEDPKKFYSIKDINQSPD